MDRILLASMLSQMDTVIIMVTTSTSISIATIGQKQPLKKESFTFERCKVQLKV